MEEFFTGCVKRLKITRAAGGTSEVLPVEVKPGWHDGTELRFPGLGGVAKAAATAQDGSLRPRDLVIVLREQPHPVFTRCGKDLMARVQVPLVNALCDGHILYNVLGGTPIRIKLPESVEVMSDVTIRGAGMPDHRGGPKGDLHLQIQVVLPNNLTEPSKAKLRKILTE
eukprot:scaffold595494_cov32-Prasinocladus_malaysianus.AAC.1